MELTERELYTVLHGLVLGTLFLLAFGGGALGCGACANTSSRPRGVQERTPRPAHRNLGHGDRRLTHGHHRHVHRVPVVSRDAARGDRSRRSVPAGGVSALLVASPGEDGPVAWVRYGVERARRLDGAVLYTAVAFAVLYYGVQLIRRGEIRSDPRLLHPRLRPRLASPVCSVPSSRRPPRSPERRSPEWQSNRLTPSRTAPSRRIPCRLGSAARPWPDGHPGGDECRRPYVPRLLEELRPRQRGRPAVGQGGHRRGGLHRVVGRAPLPYGGRRRCTSEPGSGRLSRWW